MQTEDTIESLIASAIAEAAKLGKETGTSAAEWFAQDAWEEGGDTPDAPNLSGEWADDETPRSLMSALFEEDQLELEEVQDAQDEICQAWEDACNEAFYDTLQTTFPNRYNLSRSPCKPRFQTGTISHGTLNAAHLLSAYIQAFEGFTLINGDYFAANRGERDRIANLIEEAQDCFDDGKDIRPEKEEIAAELVNDDFPRLFDRYAPDSHAFGSHEGDGSDLGFWQYDAD